MFRLAEFIVKQLQMTVNWQKVKKSQLESTRMCNISSLKSTHSYLAKKLLGLSRLMREIYKMVLCVIRKLHEVSVWYLGFSLANDTTFIFYIHVP